MIINNLSLTEQKNFELQVQHQETTEKTKLTKSKQLF